MELDQLSVQNREDLFKSDCKSRSRHVSFGEESQSTRRYTMASESRVTSTMSSNKNATFETTVDPMSMSRVKTNITGRTSILNNLTGKTRYSENKKTTSNKPPKVEPAQAAQPKPFTPFARNTMIVFNQPDEIEVEDMETVKPAPVLKTVKNKNNKNHNFIVSTKTRSIKSRK